MSDNMNKSQFYKVKHYSMGQRGDAIGDVKTSVIKAKNIKHAYEITATHSHFKNKDIKSVDRLNPSPEKYGLPAHKVVNEETELDETVLNMQQRQKRAMIMHRFQSKIERSRELAKKHMAPTENIKKRAYAKARQLVRKRVAGSRGADYQNLGPSEKIAIDRALEGKQKAIKKLALRLIPRVKAAEQKRLSSYMKGTPLVNHGAKEGSGHSSVAEDFNSFFAESFKKKAVEKDKNPKANVTDPMDSKPDDQKGVKVKGNSNIIQYGKFDEAVAKKSAKSGISEEVLKEVFNRGFEVWTEDTGVTQQQYAFARMNSFINRGKTYFNEDSDLQELSNATKQAYIQKAKPLADKLTNRYSKMRANKDKRDGEFSDDTPYMAKYGRKANNKEDGIWRASKNVSEARLQKPEVGSYHKVDEGGDIGHHVVTGVHDNVVYTQNTKTKEQFDTPLRHWHSSSSPIKEDVELDENNSSVARSMGKSRTLRKLIPGLGKNEAGERAKDNFFDASLKGQVQKNDPDYKEIKADAGRSARAAKRYSKITKEETDLNELSTHKLDQYVNRAIGAHAAGHRGAQDARDSEKPYFAALRDRRKKGIADAINKTDAATGREPEKAVKVPATMKESTHKGDYTGWKKALPNDVSHIDSTEIGDKSHAYKKIAGKNVKVATYHHKAGYGTLPEAYDESVNESSSRTPAMMKAASQNLADLRNGVKPAPKPKGPTWAQQQAKYEKHDREQFLHHKKKYEFHKAELKDLHGMTKDLKSGNLGIDPKDHEWQRGAEEEIEGMKDKHREKIEHHFRKMQDHNDQLRKPYKIKEEVEELDEAIIMKALTKVTSGHNGKMYKDVFAAHGDEIHSKIQDVRKERDENMRKHGYKAGMFHDQMLKAYGNWRQNTPAVKEETDSIIEKTTQGLWANIHAKRARIKNGSGERMRKPGTDGAPSSQDFKDANESVSEEREIPLAHRGKNEVSHYRVLNNGRDVTRHDSYEEANNYAKTHRKNLKAKGYDADRVTVHAYVKEDCESHGSKHRKTVEVVGRSGLKAKHNHTRQSEIQKKVIDEDLNAAFAEEVRSSDIKGVIVKTADGKTIVRKQKVNRKIIGSGNITDGKPDDNV